MRIKFRDAEVEVAVWSVRREHESVVVQLRSVLRTVARVTDCEGLELLGVTEWSLS